MSLLGGFVDAICAKSDDMFLYAKMVLDGIDESGGLPASVDELNQGLPVGLDGFYNDRFRQQFPEDDKEATAFFLAVGMANMGDKSR